MSELLIRARGLVAGWERPATAPLEFALESGRILGLTGANGVGKTTLLSALASRARVFSGVLDRGCQRWSAAVAGRTSG